MAEEKKDVGAIWCRTSAKGNQFLSIKIGEVEYIAFKNDKDGNEKRPDWKVYPSTPRGKPQADAIPF